MSCRFRGVGARPVRILRHGRLRLRDGQHDAEGDAARPAGQPDLTPFGVEPNRRALEILIRYSHEQRLIPRRFSVDELFEDFHRIMG